MHVLPDLFTGQCVQQAQRQASTNNGSRQGKENFVSPATIPSYHLDLTCSIENSQTDMRAGGSGQSLRGRKDRLAQAVAQAEPASPGGARGWSLPPRARCGLCCLNLRKPFVRRRQRPSNKRSFPKRRSSAFGTPTVAMSAPGLVGTVRNPRAAEVWMMALISVCYGLEVCLAPSWVT